MPCAAAAEAPRSEITLVLKDYLALVEKGDAAEKERQRRESSREAPVAEVVSQRVRVALGDGDVAEVTADYEVLVQGEPKGPVVLPVTGVPRKAEVKTPGAALSAGAKAGEWLLVAPAAGRYAVEISGPVPLSGGGVSRLDLAPAAAPVSLTEVELPADLAWSAPGTVVVEDRVEGDRRTVRLTSRRGQAQTFEVRRKVDGDAEKLLAQSLVLTLVQLRPDGPRRHDVVIYEVSRGGLGSFMSALLAFLVSFDQVESSIFLTRGANNTLPIEMFLYMEKWQDPTIAALSALLILFAFTLVVGALVVARGVDLRRILPR